jgi:outer membrane protein assembly factor BamD (BamD/ComL family)
MNSDHLTVPRGLDRSVRFVRSVRSVGVILLLALSSTSPVLATPLDDQMEAFKKADQQTEEAVARLLKTAIDEKRAAEVLAVVKPWLDLHPVASPSAQFYAGLALQNAGEWADAVIFYRKVLANKSLDPKLAAYVVPTTYRLLINDMRQPESAYLLMREDGDRLREYGKASQFDPWFLAEAKRRNDVAAVCKRLAAIWGTATPQTLPDTADLEWICQKFETFAVQDENWMPAALKLMAVPQIPEKYRARINWVKEIVPFSQKANELFRAGKPIPDALADKPLKAAEALVAVLPYEGSILVARGWMNFRDGHTPNLWRYTSPRRDAKVAPLIKAMASLPPQKAQAILSSPGCPQGRSVYQLFYDEQNYANAEMKTLIRTLPAVFNSPSAPSMDMFSGALTVEEAKALSPCLARNPSPHAALIRAYAGTGKYTASAIVPVILKSEMWRFDSVKAVLDLLGNGREKKFWDVDRGALAKQYPNLGDRYSQLSKQVSKEATSQDRMTAFTTLYQELQGASYTTPGLLGLWDDLFKQSSPADKEKILQKLVADFVAAPSGSMELQNYFLTQALVKINFGNPYSRLSFGPEFAGGWDRWGFSNVRANAQGLAADLGKILRQQVAAGTLSEPIFGLWLHCVDPKTPEAKALFQVLVKSAAYEKMNPAYYTMAGNSLLFGEAAVKLSPTDPRAVSRELLALPADAQPAAIEAALKAAMTRVTQAPEPVTVYGLQKVAALPTLTGEARSYCLSLFTVNSPLGPYPSGQGYGELAVRLLREMQKQKDWGSVTLYASAFWRAIEADDNMRARYPLAGEMVAFAEEALAAGVPSVAVSVARIGLNSKLNCLAQADTEGGGQQRVGRLRQVAGKAGTAMGVVEIPVDEKHPAYPLYKSNAEFVKGNIDSAWALYKANEDILKIAPESEEKSVLRKLSVAYSFWLLRRNIETGRAAQSEILVKELTIWSREAPGTFSMEQEAELKLAYADLAFVKGVYPTARAWYRKVVDAQEYKDSEMQVRAILGSVKVDRVTKNFSSALEDLDKLMTTRDPSARIRAHYARAEVLMDQENYKEAFDEIDAVLRGNPNHEDALILRGKLQYQMRKLVEASEIELRVARQANEVMVPGETLKINLHDPTLSVSGVGADIEIEVTAKSGDRELLLLHQFGDSKDKFRADVPTALAPPVSGDKVLQVLGVDEIRYGYSKRFRAKMKDLPPDPQTVIGIASDAYLSLSAGAFPPREGERKLDLDELGLTTAQKALGTRAVRPGNPVYIRVTDPDQSKTAAPDTLAVTLQASSGDQIRRLLLQETGPYTGEFEGIVQTASAQALAFASESAPGRDPNMTISAKSYPGWLGNVGDKEKQRIFGVDLNDNVALGKMAVSYDGPNNALTCFVLQTSMNGRDWQTRARYPATGKPLDGKPWVTSFPTYGNGSLSVSVPLRPELPVDWQEKMELTSARVSCTYLTAPVPAFSAGNLSIVGTSHPDYGALIRLTAYFYQPASAIRRFRLSGFPGKDNKDTILTFFMLDGKLSNNVAEDPLTIERELAAGLHKIEIWHQGSASQLAKIKPVLLADVPGKEELAPCPDSFFDPATFPEGVRKQIPQPAIITKQAAGDGLDIQFAEETKARLVRLVILGFEGVAPAIKAVTLTDKDGTPRLPVKEDFMELSQNSVLEVLPGDQVTARYVDEVTATPKRNRHEQRLTVAFNTATISASFLKYEMTSEGRKLVLEPIRRFTFEDAIGIVVEDADMDSSPKLDTIECRVTSSDGGSIQLPAVETEAHSGRFVGRVFPVEGKPSRDSEIQITPGATLTATYRDMENLDPGIPTDRTVTIEHARYVTPQMALYQVTSEALPPQKSVKKEPAPEKKRSSTRALGPEVVAPSRTVNYAYVPEENIQKGALKALLGATLRFDVVAPNLALAPSSEIAAYVQVVPGTNATVAGALQQPFNVELPGTLKLKAGPRGATAEVPAGYVLGASPRAPTNKAPLDEGRFAFAVPLLLGERPTRSFATKDAEALPASALPDGLAVQAGDVVKIGFAYKDDKGQVQWKLAAVTLSSHAFLDVMNSSYNETLSQSFVGEKIFVRVVALGLDKGPERDSASVSLKATSGATTTFQLRETEAHTGVFKGVFATSYADKALPAQLPSVELNGFPVRYGDEVVVSYAASDETPAQALKIQINTGADGAIEPFSKRFTGDEMAVKTSFTMAECFFELAKKHRLMDQESLARREMEHAQKLLSEAIATHRDDEMRAHAEYLLGNLSQEYADLAKNDETKLPMYQDALARFSKIPVDYPETEFAPKAQFKTALLYEKMKEHEIAVEEYVKLAYKYPKCEYIPEVMSRLGGYFQSKGQAFKDQADPLREKTDTASKAEVLRLDEQSYPEFLKAAVIFAKLQERFPDHELAGLAGLRSAQNYMRTHQYEKAIAGFKLVVDNETYDGGEIRAQALYWTGLSFERWLGVMSVDNYKARGASLQSAYQSYRRVTYDFPDSKWAKMARGRLADAVFADTIMKEEEMRTRMLESLKYEEKRRNMKKK